MAFLSRHKFAHFLLNNIYQVWSYKMLIGPFYQQRSNNFAPNNPQSVNHSTQPTSRQVELMARSLPKRQELDGVESIVVVASGKGGVGKSTTSGNNMKRTKHRILNFESSRSEFSCNISPIGPKGGLT